MGVGYKRTAARRDNNEREIISALERIAVVFPIDSPADLLVRFRHKWFVIEIKAEKGQLTPAQVDARTRLAASPGSIPVVRTVEEALIAIGAIH